MAPSTLLVLILTYLQVNFIFNAHGLTLPLQTVTTKCESITKRPQKSNLERKVNEKLPCANLASDLICSPQSPLDSCVQTSANPTGSFPVVNSLEGLHKFPILANDALFTSNISPDARLNVINSLSTKPTVGNSMLKPPAAVFNTDISLSPPNSKPPGSVNSGSKTEIPVPVPPPHNIKSQLNSLNCISSGVINLPEEIPKYISTKTLTTNFNNFDQYRSVSPNMCPKFCDSVPVNPTPNSNLGLELSCFSSNLFSSIFPGLPPLGLQSPVIQPPGFNSTVSQQTSPFVFDTPNIINKQNNPINSPGSLLVQQCDKTTSSFLSICNQTNFAPASLACSLNSNLAQFCKYPTQTPLSPDLSLIGTSLMTAPNISPNIHMCPPSNCTISSPNGLEKPGNVVKENSEPSYISPVSVNQMSPMNKYFKDVRGTTAKLKDFISSFSSRLASKKLPQAKSFTPPLKLPSVKSDCVLLEKEMEPALLVPCLRSSSPSSDFQQISIPFKEPDTSKISTIASTQSCVNNFDPPVPQLLPLTFKAPIVPKTIMSPFNFPICSKPALFNNFQNYLAPLPSCNYLPKPLTDFFTTIPSNPLAKFGSYGNLPDGSFIPPPSPVNTYLKSKLLPSIINIPTSDTNLVSPDVNTYKNVSCMPFSDLLSSILTKTQCLCELPCTNSLPYSSSDSMNILSDFDHDSRDAPLVVDECTLDSLASSLSSSPIESFLNLEHTLDESMLDLCCKNLENMIAILESSMNSNMLSSL